jgi:hypothetical protein
MMSLLEDLSGPEGWLSLMTMRYMLEKKFKWRVIPPHLKKPWEVLIHPNGLRLWKMKWGIWVPIKFGTNKKFLKEPKQWVTNGSTRQNVTPKGISKDLKHDLWLMASCKEKT